MIHLQVCILHRGGYMGMFPNSRLAKRLAGRYNKSSRVDDWCKQEPSEDDPKRLIRCHKLQASFLQSLKWHKNLTFWLSADKGVSRQERGERETLHEAREAGAEAEGGS